MPTLPALVSPRPAQADLSARMARALAAALAARRGEGLVVRAEVPVENVDALAWLAFQPAAHKAYWHGRGETETRAAWGEALAVEAPSLDVLRERLAPLLSALPPQARFYGASRFAPNGRPAPEWRAFGRVRWTLPRVELVSRPEGSRLALHLAPGERPDAALACLRLLDWPEGAEASARTLGAERGGPLPLPHAREDAPVRAGWDAMLGWALDAFSREDLKKVVLARRVRYLFDEPLSPDNLLARLQAATPRCFHALVSPEAFAEGDGAPVDDALAFVCASPERLFRLDGRRLETEAVAGTRPRALGADDRRLQDELLGSDKEQREHAYVRDAIAGRLAPLTDALDVDTEASAMNLARGRHLYSGFRGTLREGASALDLLCALHPTPAVGGTPRADALDAIARLEPFDRGLYAGPLGWIGADGAEIAVGIRSGLVRGRELALYSGAGIVEGSEPSAEWAEIEGKIGDFAGVLGLS